MIQNSFKNEKPTLYLVPTPIGNLQEMTPRAIEILKCVDIVAAEDTRTFGKLREHFGIKTPITSYHMHNEKESSQYLLKLLHEGKNVALVSDAGYPLISDPGQTVVFDVVQAGFNVTPISGSSAFLNALVASGLVVQPFAFIGFLEGKESALKKQLLQYKDMPMTTIYYLSVHKLQKTLEMVYDVLGNREICIARELTKQHETFIRGPISEVMETIDVYKGEFVLVVGKSQAAQEITLEEAVRLVETEIENGELVSRAISKISKTHKISKNDLYEAVHTHK